MLDQVKVYKERMQKVLAEAIQANNQQLLSGSTDDYAGYKFLVGIGQTLNDMSDSCLLYTSPSPRDKRQSRMPSSA